MQSPTLHEKFQTTYETRKSREHMKQGKVGRDNCVTSNGLSETTQTHMSDHEDEQCSQKLEILQE
uniref:Uncharacterized protein n=1 Tax=Arundo donax TaxID=35708 RepID=A0A0A9A6J9_ARUDO